MTGTQIWRIQIPSCSMISPYLQPAGLLGGGNPLTKLPYSFLIDYWLQCNSQIHPQRASPGEGVLQWEDREHLSPTSGLCTCRPATRVPQDIGAQVGKCRFDYLHCRAAMVCVEAMEMHWLIVLFASHTNVLNATQQTRYEHPQASSSLQQGQLHAGVDGILFLPVSG